MAHAKSGTQTTMDCHLFGYPTLQLNDQLLHMTLPKKGVALLAYVAVAEEPIGRETVVALLWPDAPRKTAQQSLRNLLSTLRSELSDLLTVTSRTITIEPEFTQQIDVVRFQRGIRAIRSAQSNQESLDLQLWQATLDLYQDDFLAGFHILRSPEFDEWALLQREYLREQAIANLFSLSEAHAAADNVDLALAALTRLLAIEPWHEAAYRQQIELLQASGRRAEALQLYDRYRQLLADEFALEPSAEMSALYQQIKAGVSAPVGTHRRPTQPQVPTRTSSTTNSAARGETIPNNLAYPLRIFFGREKELTLIQQRITSPACRLLTIVGAGGMGKTALAEEVGLHLLRSHAANFPDGIFFVLLSGIQLGENGTREHEPDADERHQWEEKAAAARQRGNETSTQHDGHDAIAAAIARSIGCELPGQIPVLAQLQAYLRTKRLLLILDNFEHLLAGAGTLAALLSRAPALSMVVTSRFVLGIQGETVLRLDKLSLPPTSYLVQEGKQGVGTTDALQIKGSAPAVAHLLQGSEAAAMFVQRVQRYDPHFELNAQNAGAVAQICHLVEGLPLGVELAAGISPALGCQALATELAQSLDLLVLETLDLPAAQRSLWAVFARSWQLLIPQEQQLLAQLSIFPDSFDLRAATAIAEASIPLLLRLINHSLLGRVGDDRYAMHRTIRAFAGKQLQQWPEVVDAVQVRFVRYYLAFFDQQRPILQGKDHAAAVERIFVELDNIRVAWRWGAARRMTAELNGCARVHFLFYEPQGLYVEAGELYEYTLQQFAVADEIPRDGSDDAVHLLIGRLQSYLATIHAHFRAIAKANAMFRAGFAHLQQAGDPCDTAFCLALWGATTRVFDLEQAKALALRAIPLVQAVNPYYESFVYITLGETSRMLGTYDDAKHFLRIGYRRAKELDWTWGLANGQRLLGQLQLSQGNYAAAEQHLRDCIKFTRKRRLQLLMMEATVMLGRSLQLQARVAEAQACYTESLQLAEALQIDSVRTLALWAQGCLAEQQEEYAAAKAHFTASLAAGNAVRVNKALPTLGWAFIGLGELEAAHSYFQQVCDDAQARHAFPICLDAQVGLAYLQGIRGQPARQPRTGKPAAVGDVLQFVYTHPAATQETCGRVINVASTLGLPLMRTNHRPPNALRNED